MSVVVYLFPFNVYLLLCVGKQESDVLSSVVTLVASVLFLHSPGRLKPF